MQTKVFATTVLLALVAGSEAARPKPYMVARAPATSLFGLMRRDGDGYQPETELCGDGNTCSEACGSGYEQCASSDNNNHCFNPAAGDTCCGVKSGDACETGFYCSHDSSKNTICCPADMDLEACAAALSPNGALTSDFPATSTTPTSTPTSTPTTAPTTTAPTTTAPTTTKTADATSTTTTAAVTVSAPIIPQSSSTYVIQTSSSLSSVPFPTESSSPSEPAESTSPSAPGETTVPGSAAGIKATLGLVVAAFFVALL